jgi:hypothetical protein
MKEILDNYESYKMMVKKFYNEIKNDAKKINDESLLTNLEKVNEEASGLLTNSKSKFIDPSEGGFFNDKKINTSNNNNRTSIIKQNLGAAKKIVDKQTITKFDKISLITLIESVLTLLGKEVPKKQTKTLFQAIQKRNKQESDVNLQSSQPKKNVTIEH